MSRKGPAMQECDHILIVEGYSDLLFIASILRHLNRAEGVYIQEFTGKAKLLNADLLSSFLTPKILAEKKSIGILIDADTDAAATAQAVRNRLMALAGRSVTEGNWDEQPDGPGIGFFVLPDGNAPGAIETLVWNALPDDARYRSMKEAVDGFDRAMTDLGWKAGSADKGRIGAFLSAANVGDPRLGPGAREGCFDLGSSGFARLRRFLEVLPTRP